MTSPRSQIIQDFARWTALSSTRSGSPVKARAAVYPLLDSVDFSPVLDPGPVVNSKEFDEWHQKETMALTLRHEKLVVGWSAKLINVYLKTATYVGDLGRPGIRSAVHPPIDGGPLVRYRQEIPGREGDPCRDSLRPQDQSN